MHYLPIRIAKWISIAIGNGYWLHLERLAKAIALGYPLANR